MTPEAVAKIIVDSGMGFVRVFRGGIHSATSAAAFCTKDYTSADNEMDPNRSAQLFLWFMTESTPGTYTVRIKANSKSSKEHERELVVENKGAAAAVSGPAQGANLADLEAKLNAQFDLRIAQYEAKVEKEKMLAENAELKARLKEVESSEYKTSARIGLLAEKGVEVLMERLGIGASMAPAIHGPGGIEDAEIATNDVTLEQLVEPPLKQLYASIGNDLVVLLRRLAQLDPHVLRKLAVISDEKVQMAAPFL